MIDPTDALQIIAAVLLTFATGLGVIALIAIIVIAAAETIHSLRKYLTQKRFRS